MQSAEGADSDLRPDPLHPTYKVWITGELFGESHEETAETGGIRRK